MDRLQQYVQQYTEQQQDRFYFLRHCIACLRRLRSVPLAVSFSWAGQVWPTHLVRKPAPSTHRVHSLTRTCTSCDCVLFEHPASVLPSKRGTRSSFPHREQRRYRRRQSGGVQGLPQPLQSYELELFCRPLAIFQPRRPARPACFHERSGKGTTLVKIEEQGDLEVPLFLLSRRTINTAHPRKSIDVLMRIEAGPKMCWRRENTWLTFRKRARSNLPTGRVFSTSTDDSPRSSRRPLSWTSLPARSTRGCITRTTSESTASFIKKTERMAWSSPASLRCHVVGALLVPRTIPRFCATLDASRLSVPN